MKKTLSLYFTFLLFFTIFSYLFIDPNLQYLQFIFSPFFYENRLIVTLIFIFLILIFYLFYYWFIYGINSEKILSRHTKPIFGISIAGLILSYPAMLSYDIFNYIATAKTLFFYGENPYIIMPIEFLNDPLLAFTHAANKVALYGFFWVLLSGMPYLLGFNNFLLALFNFKLLILIFYLLTIVVFYKLSKDIKSLFLFALNPLVLIETFVSTHNDIVMILLALSSFYFLKKNKLFFALLLFLMSVFIKYATIFLLPPFLFVIFFKLFKKDIHWESIFRWSSFCMLLVFFAAPFREEIYPWYFIWVLSFFFINPIKKLTPFVILFSFGLLLRYVPFMYSGTYFGSTPIVKIIVTFIFPAACWLLLLLIKKRNV